MYVIYTLTDPRNHLVYYVGMSGDVQARFRQHLMRDGNWFKSAWVEELKKDGLLPLLDIVSENLTYEEAQEQECQLIHQYYNAGMPLTNIENCPWGKKRRNWSSPVTLIRSVRIMRTVIKPAVVTKPLVEDLLTLEDAGKKLGVSKYTVRRYIEQGLLEGILVGRFWRVRPSVLQHYIEEQTKPKEK